MTQDPGDTDVPEGAASTAEGAVVSGPFTGEPSHSAPPVLPGLPTPRRYTARFAVTYTLLGIVLAGALAGLVVLVMKPGHASTSGWSTWRPTSGTTAIVTSQIANHVAHEYKLNSKGAELVAIVPSAPNVTSGTHKVSISHIAIKSVQKSQPVQITTTAGAWMDQFCGLGTSCSIASGQATSIRGQLVRREALEVALYTFKFAPRVSSVIAFMPPPPGQTASTLLYLQKSNYATQLSEPLRKTLPLATPPLPTNPDLKEAATINKLTLSSLYSFAYQPLEDNSALLVLSPAS